MHIVTCLFSHTHVVDCTFFSLISYENEAYINTPCHLSSPSCLQHTFELIIWILTLTENRRFKNKVLWKFSAGKRREIPLVTWLQKQQGEFSYLLCSACQLVWQPASKMRARSCSAPTNSMCTPYPPTAQTKVTNETEGTDAIMGKKTRERAQDTVCMSGRRLVD